MSVPVTDVIIAGSIRTEVHVWEWTYITVRCGKCGSEFEAGHEAKTTRCKRCGRTCRLDKAAEAGPNVIPLRRKPATARPASTA